MTVELVKREPTEVEAAETPQGLKLFREVVATLNTLRPDFFVDIVGDGEDSPSCVTLDTDGRRETLPLDGLRFSRLLRRQADDALGLPLSDHDVQRVVKYLDAKASRTPRALFVRCAYVGGTLYHDLDTEGGHVVAIRAGSSPEVLTDSPVAFRRSGKGSPLPLPNLDGDPAKGIRRLAALLPPGEDLYLLSVFFLLECLRPGNERVALSLWGKRGSGKTGVAKLIKRLLDPVGAKESTGFKDVRVLASRGRSQYVLTMGNVGPIGHALSDDLCVVLDDGSFSARRMRTNFDGDAIESLRPVIFTSVKPCVINSDLARRTLTYRFPEELRVTEDDTRRAERTEEAAPHILGALYHAAGQALRDRNAVGIGSTDFSRIASLRWAEAAVPALGIERGTFVDLIERLKVDAIDMGDPRVSALLDYFATAHPDGCDEKMTIGELVSRLPVGSVDLKRANHFSKDLRLHDAVEEMAAGGLRVEWAPPKDKTRRHRFIFEGHDGERDDF